MLIRCLILVCILCSITFVPSLVKAQQELKELSESREWKKLLHINNAKTEIDSIDFFLTPPSHQDFTFLELVSTAENAKQNNIQTNGFSFRCNYPARSLFLAKHKLIDNFSLGECKELIDWIGSENFDISIIYADGYLGNPASFYGHLILKFETGGITDDLFTNSLNFGASVPDNENPVIYIVKGLFGGYEAEYSSNYFFRHNLNYTEVEMRDLWKYRLQLNEYQKHLLAAHAWELMRTKYTYYFTSRNCAYHLAKAIEVVTEQDILSSNHPFVLPIDVFKNMEKMDNNGKPLVAPPEYIPSRQSKFRHQFSLLNKSQQRLLFAFFNNQQTLMELKIHNDSVLLDVMYEYAAFAITQAKKDTRLLDKLNAKKREIQLARIKLPPATKDVLVPKPDVDPDVGHKPSLVRFQLGQNTDNEFLDVIIRPAFYDLLSSGGSLLPNSALTMGELGLRSQDDNIEFSHLELLKIETYPTGATGLKFDEGLSWNLELGGERDYIDGLDNSFEWYVSGGAGYAHQASENFAVYGVLNGKLTTPNAFSSRAFLTPTVGFIGQINSSRINCELGYVIDIENATQRSKRHVACNASFYQTETSDFRLGVSSYFNHELSLSFSWYW